MNPTGRRISWFLLLFLLLFMPYATFVLQEFRHLADLAGHPFSANLIRLTVGWKELILLIFLISILELLLRFRRLPFNMNSLDWFLLCFTLFGVLWGGWQVHRLSPIVFGFRYDFSLFFFYAAARLLPVSLDRIEKILRILLYTSLPLLLFAYLQTFLLPSDFMQRFGYVWGGTSVTGNPLPPYHLVANHYVRAMSTFPGPNSLAMYLVFLFLLIVFVGGRWFSRWLQITLAVLFLIGILITFSRGHIIALVVALILLPLFFWLQHRFSPAMTGWLMAAVTTLVLILSFAGTYYAGSLQGSLAQGKIGTILLHDESTQIHRDVALQAWQNIKSHPGGTGLGTSGLATTNTGGTVFNPESWYLQITQELGWLAPVWIFILFALMFQLIAGMWKNAKDQPTQNLLKFLLVSFMAILVSANFLPSWFEVTSIAWWVLFGFLLSPIYDYER